MTLWTIFSVDVFDLCSLAGEGRWNFTSRICDTHFQAGSRFFPQAFRFAQPVSWIKVYYVYLHFSFSPYLFIYLFWVVFCLFVFSCLSIRALRGIAPVLRVGTLLAHPHLRPIPHCGPAEGDPQELMSDRWKATIWKRHYTAAESLPWYSVKPVLMQHTPAANLLCLLLPTMLLKSRSQTK